MLKLLSKLSPPVTDLIAYEPDLIPPLALMRSEGIDVFEEWFRWAEEWSVLLRIYGRITRSSDVLEIGCGLGRIAFPLRYILRQGGYNGFEICREKVDFLQSRFTPAHPNFRFTWADVYNSYYNPEGSSPASEYRFPYADQSFDLVFAASVFTHMLPQNARRYFAEAARVLRPGGRCVFSFFLLEYYRSKGERPHGFAREGFDFEHHLDEFGSRFAFADPDNLEMMTAFSTDLVETCAREAGLRLAEPPLPGFWSGSSETWVGAQDLVVLEKIPS